MNSDLNLRCSIGATLRELRITRRWTQNDLAKRLHVSQPHLSQVERGQRSLTAEQFLAILKLFNVAVTDFVPPHDLDPELELQNALARFGATHLQEHSDLLPRRDLEDVNKAVDETVRSGTPRLLTALAPVLTAHADRLNLSWLETSLTRAGYERRLGWLLENVLDALQRELQTSPSRTYDKQYRRARVVLETFSSASSGRWLPPDASGPLVPDVLDREIRSRRSVEEVRTQASEISNRWGIVSRLQPDDFAHALRVTRVAD